MAGGHFGIGMHTGLWPGATTALEVPPCHKDNRCFKQLHGHDGAEKLANEENPSNQSGLRGVYSNENVVQHYRTFHLQCLRISSDLIVLSFELGLLKRPTTAVIVSAVIGSHSCTSSSSFARDTTWKVVKVKESPKGSTSHAHL